jgi:cytochrome b involved in lipid metabolism
MSESTDFTFQQIAEHNTKKDLYLIVHDKVYDCTSFVDEHPYVDSVSISTLPRTLSSLPGDNALSLTLAQSEKGGREKRKKKSRQTLFPSSLPYRTTPPPISPSSHPQITSESKTANNLYSGGEEVLLDVGGQDSTEAFEDVGHSDEAREILDGLLVGTVKRVVRTNSPAPLDSYSTKINTSNHALYTLGNMPCDLTCTPNTRHQKSYTNNPPAR